MASVNHNLEFATPSEIVLKSPPLTFKVSLNATSEELFCNLKSVCI